MKPLDLLETARLLIDAASRKLTTACCKRAVSSCHYALFHCLAQECADLLIGGVGADRSDPALRQTYRALEHGFAKERCKNPMIRKFPKEIEDFANTFVTMQEKRHKADYDPFETFTKVEVAADITLIGSVIGNFKSISARHRRAFCVYVLLRDRRP